MRLLLGASLLVLAGCSSVLPSPYAVTDEELKARGEWTETDARARALIGGARGALDYRPVRLVSWARKLTSLKSAIETICGLNYETPYVYAAEARAYVVPQRGRPAVILPDEWDRETRADDDPEPTPELAWQRLRRQLDADLRELFGEPGPPPVTERVEP